jgi:hypothetical protein
MLLAVTCFRQKDAAEVHEKKLTPSILQLHAFAMKDRTVLLTLRTFCPLDNLHKSINLEY